MGTVRILVEKELRNHFSSWSIYIGYILFFCICGFQTWLSSNNIFDLGQASLMPFFVIINWTQFILIPALTMKTIADEKKSGTIELLLTKPIKTWELICEKFFSNLIITVIALVLTIPYYITIATLGNIDHGAAILGYIGLIEMAACYVSIGIFSSALCRTPVTAFFLSLGIGLCFQVFFGMLANQIGTGFMAELFSYLSMEEHFDSISRGILDTRDIIYFSSVVTIFLASSKYFICKSRF